MQVRRPGGEILLQMELHQLTAGGPGLEPNAATGGLEKKKEEEISPGVCAVPVFAVVRGLPGCQYRLWFARLPTLFPSSLLPSTATSTSPSYTLLADLQTPGNLVPTNFPHRGV